MKAIYIIKEWLKKQKTCNHAWIYFNQNNCDKRECKYCNYKEERIDGEWFEDLESILKYQSDAI